MLTEKRSSMLHGVLLIGLFSCAAFYIGEAQIFKQISFSPMIIGISLGMLYANSLRNHLPETWVPGIQFCSKKLLRLGIILYGFRLTFQDILSVGTAAIMVDIIIVVVTILGGVWLGKLLKMDRDIALLTSIGSGICGAAAVLGAESTIRTKPYKTAVAVATVVIFGTISMFLYPIAYRAGWLGLDPGQMGIYTGATLHEVAHTVGAGNAMGETIKGTLNRSATILSGEGAFTHESRKVILTVMGRAQAVKLRLYIRSIDPHAFIVISNTSEIIGKGFRETL